MSQLDVTRFKTVFNNRDFPSVFIEPCQLPYACHRHLIYAMGQ